MKKLIGYITASYPSNQFTIDVISSLSEAGVDIIELGIPFSDPIADGKIIEEAGLKSLQNGFKIKDIFTISSSLDKKIEIFWMGYFNIFYRYGIKEIINKAVKLNIEGFIIPDLPFEESLKYQNLMEIHKLSLINFISPLSSKNRIREILLNRVKKFIYLVAYAGITGDSKDINLDEVIQNIREETKAPIYIGFGINKNNAKDKVKDVDGVIVGSAFIKILINESLSLKQRVKLMVELAKNIKNQIN